MQPSLHHYSHWQNGSCFRKKEQYFPSPVCAPFSIPERSTAPAQEIPAGAADTHIMATWSDYLAESDLVENKPPPPQLPIGDAAALRQTKLLRLPNKQFTQSIGSHLEQWPLFHDLSAGPFN